MTIKKINEAFDFMEKKLKSKQLNEMAQPRKIVINELENQSPAFVEHFFKLYFYRNTTQDFNKWIKTLVNILYRKIYSLKVATKGNPKPNENLLEQHFLYYRVNEPIDINLFLTDFYQKGFPELELGNYELFEAFEFYKTFCEKLKKILRTTEYTEQDFTKLLEHTFED